MVSKTFAAALMLGLFIGCTASKPSYVNPGMSRQEVIQSLGPPLAVVAKDSINVEYLHYRVPPLDMEGAAGQDILVDLVVPIHEDRVMSPDHPTGPH